MAPEKSRIAQVFAPLAEGDEDGFFANVKPGVGEQHNAKTSSQETNVDEG
jgi:hypothetical protein